MNFSVPNDCAAINRGKLGSMTYISSNKGIDDLRKYDNLFFYFKYLSIYYTTTRSCIKVAPQPRSRRRLVTVMQVLYLSRPQTVKHFAPSHTWTSSTSRYL